MSFLDRVAACNRYDLSTYRPFVVDDQTIGWIGHSFLGVLAEAPAVFTIEDGRVGFCDPLRSAEHHTDAVAEVAKSWSGQSWMPRLRGEIYPVRSSWKAPDLFRLDRALVSLFGVRAYGVHLNGFVRCSDGIHLWLGRRSESNRVAPGKLDNMVAGGQPAGITVFDNLMKECSEEASVPEQLARHARPVGTVSYCFEGERGLKPDTLFCFDLEVPDDFRPVNQDGEIAGFTLVPLSEALSLIDQGESFKFNVSLVILDFAIRHGVLTPDGETDYEAILAGLHTPFPQLKTG